MDYEIQMHIRNSENYIRSPDFIEPKELSQYLASYTCLGVNDFITSLVQRYFYINLNHPDLIRYIHLLDQLIKFSFPLPQNFVDMYAQCYNMAVQNGRKSSQQELKILRKIWTPILSDSIINELRSEVYKLTQIDIQQDLRQESKRFLHQYFQKTLMLSQKDIYQILYRKPLTRIVYQKNQILCPRPPQTQFLHTVEELNKPRKMSKLSEDTEAESKLMSRKTQAILILDRLKNINNFSCKQCGKSFQTQKGLDNHNKDHFEERMKNYKKNMTHESFKKLNMVKNGVKKQKDIQSWIKQKQVDQNELIFNVQISFMDPISLDRKCKFCGCQFDVDIIDDAFVYKNSVKVRMRIESEQSKDQIDIMHYQCYHTLITSTNQ